MTNPDALHKRHPKKLVSAKNTHQRLGVAFRQTPWDGIHWVEVLTSCAPVAISWAWFPLAVMGGEPEFIRDRCWLDVAVVERKKMRWKVLECSSFLGSGSVYWEKG